MQNVLYNLNISHIEVRSEEDKEVSPYTRFNSNKSSNSNTQGAYIIKQLHSLMSPSIMYLCDKQVLLTDKSDSLSSFILDDAEW